MIYANVIKLYKSTTNKINVKYIKIKKKKYYTYIEK